VQQWLVQQWLVQQWLVQQLFACDISEMTLVSLVGIWSDYISGYLIARYRN
jgi:hypothetical protein